MINAKELRIGNLVKDHLGRIQTVAEVRHDAYICYLRNGAKLKYKLNTTQPIPLTEEWLLKFSFERFLQETKFKLYFNKNKDSYYASISVSLHSDFCRVNVINQEITKVQYVHQLQNLYFCLCGEELEIKNTL